MLGRIIKVGVTDRINAPLGNTGRFYKLNHGRPLNKLNSTSPVSGVFIMGIDNPVNRFDGKVIAQLRFFDNGEVKLVAAPKSKRFIDCEIKRALAFFTAGREFQLDCLYERSCGAVIYRKINGQTRFLLIKNRRSSNWGFPKGHMEDGETPEDTAKREVLEETGIRIEILPEFSSKSEYIIHGKTEKCVIIFIGRTNDTQTKIQREEIEDYIWLTYNDALKNLKFENDRKILENARGFLIENNYIQED